MLLNPTSNLQISSIENDPSGRYIIMKIIIEGANYFLIRVYAPTDNREQENFMQWLSVNLISKTDTSRVIIVGDWNITLNKLDKHGGLTWKETTYRNAGAVCDLTEVKLVLLTFTALSIQKLNNLHMNRNPCA